MVSSLGSAQNTLAKNRKILNDIHNDQATTIVEIVVPELTQNPLTFNREVRTLSNLMSNGLNDYDLGQYIDYLTYKANPQRAEMMQKERRRTRILSASLLQQHRQAQHPWYLELDDEILDR